MKTFTVEEDARRCLSAHKLNHETQLDAAEATIAIIT